MNTKHAVVLLSGGMDSSTLLYQLLFEDFQVDALAVHYGQKHSRELAAAFDVANAAGVRLLELDLGEALRPVFAFAASSQVGQKQAVPHGHYAADSMKTTIVPNRNMMLLAMAGTYAVSIGATVIGYAAHSGDHAIYPDCRPEFASAMNNALQLGNDPPITLYRPFIGISKTDIASRGHALNVPFALTYSCYEGREDHCGLCGTCVERREAFRDSGVPDPTTYETPATV